MRFTLRSLTFAMQCRRAESIYAIITEREKAEAYVHT